MSRTISRSPELERLRYAWVTTSKAAELIGGEKPVSTAHVVRLIEVGALRARNVAMPTATRKDWRIDPASIEKFLDGQTTGGERAPNPPPSGPSPLPDPAFVVRSW